MDVRRRLSPAARRDHLLDVAEKVFAEVDYEAVVFDDLAAQAGVSRALLYRHFPGKRALFAALYQRAADRMLGGTDFDPQLSIPDQAALALDAYLDYFSANARTVLTANVILAGDAGVQNIITTLLDGITQRWLATNAPDPGTHDVIAAILSSWLAFVRELCVQWLDKQALSRTDVRTISLSALHGALVGVSPQPPHRPSAVPPFSAKMDGDLSGS